MEPEQPPPFNQQQQQQQQPPLEAVGGDGGGGAKPEKIIEEFPTIISSGDNADFSMYELNSNFSIYKVDNDGTLAAQDIKNKSLIEEEPPKQSTDSDKLILDFNNPNEFLIHSDVPTNSGSASQQNYVDLDFDHFQPTKSVPTTTSTETMGSPFAQASSISTNVEEEFPKNVPVSDNKNLTMNDDDLFSDNIKTKNVDDLFDEKFDFTEMNTSVISQSDNISFSDNVDLLGPTSDSVAASVVHSDTLQEDPKVSTKPIDESTQLEKSVLNLEDSQKTTDSSDLSNTTEIEINKSDVTEHSTNSFSELVDSPKVSKDDLSTILNRDSPQAAGSTTTTTQYMPSEQAVSPSDTILAQEPYQDEDFINQFISTVPATIPEEEVLDEVSTSFSSFTPVYVEKRSIPEVLQAEQVIVPESNNDFESLGTIEFGDSEQSQSQSSIVDASSSSGHLVQTLESPEVETVKVQSGFVEEFVSKQPNPTQQFIEEPVLSEEPKPYDVSPISASSSKIEVLTDPLVLNESERSFNDDGDAALLHSKFEPFDAAKISETKDIFAEQIPTAFESEDSSSLIGNVISSHSITPGGDDSTTVAEPVLPLPPSPPVEEHQLAATTAAVTTTAATIEKQQYERDDDDGNGNSAVTGGNNQQWATSSITSQQQTAEQELPPWTSSSSSSLTYDETTKEPPQQAAPPAVAPIEEPLLPTPSPPPPAAVVAEKATSLSGISRKEYSPTDTTQVSTVTAAIPTTTATSASVSSHPPPVASTSSSSSTMGRKNYRRDNSVESEADLGPDQVKEYIQNVLGPNVAELVYWRDPKHSGVVFGIGFIILLSLTIFSVISVVAYTLLFTLLGTLSFRVYKNVLQAVQKTEEGHPFKEYLDIEINPSPERIHEIVDSLVAHGTCFVKRMRAVLLVEDIVDSLKYLLIFWALTYIGAWFNGLTLVILAYISAFSVPKLYEQNKAQIDQYLELVNSKITEISDKVPFLKKQVPVEKKEE